MAVDTQHEEYIANVNRWRLVNDICDEVNLADHINDLNVLEDPEKNRDFKDRASFFGATGFTEQGLIGIAFEEKPEIDLPPIMDYLRENADGTGLSLDNQMNGALSQVLRCGRVGLFATYPQVVDGASVADQQAGRVVATIHKIDADRIINWWTVQNGAQTMLGGVVFTDKMEERDGFDVEIKDILRTLTLEDGRLVDRKWHNVGKSWEVFEEVEPRNGSGRVMTQIPFVFAGAVDNTWRVDPAPLYSLAKTNADHLNNSAINEEGIWFSGHIQPVADEMDPAVIDALKDAIASNRFKIGSGQMLVAKGFRFEVAEPNSAARVGMEDKEKRMMALGAGGYQPRGLVHQSSSMGCGLYERAEADS